MPGASPSERTTNTTSTTLVTRFVGRGQFFGGEGDNAGPTGHRPKQDGPTSQIHVTFTPEGQSEIQGQFEAIRLVPPHPLA